MVFSWQSAASASSDCVSFFSIMAVLSCAKAASRTDFETVLFMAAVPRRARPTQLTGIYR